MTKEFREKLYKENSDVYSNTDFEGYAWVLKNIEPLNITSEINGKLSLWNIDDKILEKIN